MSLGKLVTRARGRWQRGDFAGGVQLAHAALAKGYTKLDVHALLGDCYFAMHQFENALGAYQQALAIEPTSPTVRFLCGEMLFHLGRYPESVDALLNLDLTHCDQNLRVECAITLGRALHYVGRIEPAEMSLVQALLIDPKSENALYNLAAFYDLTGLPHQALKILEPAVRANPSSVLLQYQLSTFLCRLGLSEPAIATLEATVHLSPRHAKAHQNLGIFNLRVGQLAVGWRHYAWRSSRHEMEGSNDDWEPQTPLFPMNMEGMAIDVMGEQGIGDVLFFLRYLPALKSRGAFIRFRLSIPRMRELLVPLLRSGLIDEFIEGAPQPLGGQAIYIGDLPLALGEPDMVAYPQPIKLVADVLSVSRLRDGIEILRSTRPKLGITWRSGTAARGDRTEFHSFLSKEVPLDKLLDILRPLNVDIVVLQRNPTAAELQQILVCLGEHRCFDASGIDQDLCELLALLACLDGLVGVSNTNIHLFAGLGKTADVLVPHPSEFRWLESGTGSPWFPEFGVFRQDPNLDWDAPLRELAVSLQQRFVQEHLSQS